MKLTKDEILKLHSRNLNNGYSKLADIPHYSLLKDIDKGAKRIADAIRNKESIKLCADYDGDGILSCATAISFFQDIGYPLEWTIPNRFTEGNGVQLDRIHPRRDPLEQRFATADCAVSGADQVRYGIRGEGGERSPESRWITRMESSLLNFFGKQYEWPRQWDSQGVFRNSYWLRNPNFKAKNLFEVDFWALTDSRCMPADVAAAQTLRCFGVAGNQRQAEHQRSSHEGKRISFMSPSRLFDTGHRIDPGDFHKTRCFTMKYF